MKTIYKNDRCGISLNVGKEYDGDGELEITILDVSLGDKSVWVNKKEVKKLILHLLDLTL